MAEIRAVNVRIFDHIPRVEQLAFLAAREAFGVPAEVEFDIHEIGRDFLTPNTIITSGGPDQPEISVRHADGQPIDPPAYDPGVVATMWLAHDVPMEPVVARVGEKLDALGVSWDAREWVGPGGRLEPMDVARQAFPTAGHAVDRPTLEMPTAKPPTAPTAGKTLGRSA